MNYVEFALPMGYSPLLPPNTVLVDLPDGEAGQERHERFMLEGLENADAIILVAGGNRFNSQLAVPIFDQVRVKVTEGKRPDIAARMMFLVAIH